MNSIGNSCTMANVFLYSNILGKFFNFNIQILVDMFTDDYGHIQTESFTIQSINSKQ